MALNDLIMGRETWNLGCHAVLCSKLIPFENLVRITSIQMHTCASNLHPPIVSKSTNESCQSVWKETWAGPTTECLPHCFVIEWHVSWYQAYFEGDML